jgi:iron-sulfur cluster repair protein YtfE (RIC family)
MEIQQKAKALSMSPTQRYRSQQDEILRLIAEIQALMQRIGEPELRCNCRTLLLELSRKLTAHLTVEDTYLYPRLIGHENKALRETAIAFQAEMEGLWQAVRGWSIIWLVPGAIAREPAQFTEETSDLFCHLKQRVSREEAQLYPLIDRIGWSAVTGVC